MLYFEVFIILATAVPAIPNTGFRLSVVSSPLIIEKYTSVADYNLVT